MKATSFEVKSLPSSKRSLNKVILNKEILNKEILNKEILNKKISVQTRLIRSISVRI